MPTSRERTKLSLPFTSKWFWIPRYKYDRQIWYQDHIGWMICKIKGHIPYLADPEEKSCLLACRRCSRYINYPETVKLGEKLR